MSTLNNMLTVNTKGCFSTYVVPPPSSLPAISQLFSRTTTILSEHDTHQFLPSTKPILPISSTSNFLPDTKTTLLPLLPSTTLILSLPATNKIFNNSTTSKQVSPSTNHSVHTAPNNFNSLRAHGPSTPILYLPTSSKITPFSESSARTMNIPPLGDCCDSLTRVERGDHNDVTL